MTTAYVTAEDQIVAYDPGEHTLEDNFRRFHTENPHVYETLVRLALDWRAKRPGQQCGIGMLYEVARWEIDLRGEGEPVALNNNYRAFFARMMMEREPELEGLFEVRRQRGLEGANPVSSVKGPGFAPSSSCSTSGGADAGLAAAPAARTVGPSAPPEDAAAGSSKHTPPAAATLFDMPAEPAWA